MQIIPYFINHNLPRASRRRSFERIMRDMAGNSGNAYITHSIARLIGIHPHNIHGIRNIWLDIEKVDIDTIRDINHSYTHAIFIMQDQIREHDSYHVAIPFQKITDFIEKIKIPIIVISLGHNSFTSNSYDHNLPQKISPDLISLLKTLSYKCDLLGVRGNYTIEILNSLGITNAIAVGCPSLFSPGPRRTIIEKKSWNNDLRLGMTGSLAYIDRFPNSYSIFQDLNERFFIKLASHRNTLLNTDFDHLFLFSSPHKEHLINLTLNNRTRFFVSVQPPSS